MYHEEQKKKQGQEKEPEHEEDPGDRRRSILARIQKVEMEAEIQQLTRTLERKEKQLLEEAKSPENWLRKAKKERKGE